MICAGTPGLCGCSTRRQHERGDCRRDELAADLERAIKDGSAEFVTEWDEITEENGWTLPISAQNLMDSPIVVNYDESNDYFFAEDWNGKQWIAKEVDGNIATMSY